MTLNKTNFSTSLEGKETDLFLLKNSNGIQAYITNYGARIVALIAFDKANKPVDLVVGFETIADYLDTDEFYHGAIIGRFANRIKQGSFSLEEQTYNLATNNGPNHLHGGLNGFHHKVWDVIQKDSNSIKLSLLSQDGEEGYPGNMHIIVHYILTDENELKINYEAYTDKATIINVTNHAYFNLNGQGNGTILDHTLYINADKYTPIDTTSIPLGTLDSVAGTSFDFRIPKTIGKHIDTPDEQLLNGSGYDHNFVLNKVENELALAASAVGNVTGLKLEILTSEPGVQLYTGNFMQGSNKIKYGKRDAWRSAFCLETQHFPDSPNQPSFPTTVLQPGDTFKSSTVYRLSVVA